MPGKFSLHFSGEKMSWENFPASFFFPRSRRKIFPPFLRSRGEPGKFSHHLSLPSETSENFPTTFTELQRRGKIFPPLFSSVGHDGKFSAHFYGAKKTWENFPPTFFFRKKGGKILPGPLLPAKAEFIRNSCKPTSASRGLLLRRNFQGGSRAVWTNS